MEVDDEVLPPIEESEEQEEPEQKQVYLNVLESLEAHLPARLLRRKARAASSSAERKASQGETPEIEEKKPAKPVKQKVLKS